MRAYSGEIAFALRNDSPYQPSYPDLAKGIYLYRQGPLYLQKSRGLLMFFHPVNPIPRNDPYKIQGTTNIVIRRIIKWDQDWIHIIIQFLFQLIDIRNMEIIK